MGNINRTERIEQLSKSLRKYYKPTPIATDRPVLDLMLYACCLEDAKFEVADEAFAKLQQSYFDWNEVRVTTVAELAEVLSSLPAPGAAATRIKKVLQAMFESRYSFDIEEVRKANLGKTLTEFEAWNGMTKFVCAFVAQNALGGHAIPVDAASIMVLQMADIVSQSDAEKGIVPGLDRSIQKAKGSEFATMLHQFAAEFRANNKAPNALNVFKDLNINPKNKPVPPPPPPDPKKIAAEARAAAKLAAAAARPQTKSGKPEPAGKGKPLTIKEPDSRKAIPPAKAATPTKPPIPVKKVEVKGADLKGPHVKSDPKKPDTKKIELKKPDPKKPEPKKPEVKKIEPPKAITKTPKAPEKKPTTKGAPKPPAKKSAPLKPASKPGTGNTKKPTPPSKPASKPKPADPKKTAVKKIVKKKPK